MNAGRRSEIRVKGLKLSYLEWGVPRDGAPSLICLHGLLATGESYARLASEMGSAAHLVALDLPGNGESETRRDLDVSFAGLAEVTAAFVDALGWRSVIMVGHSHGGALALRLAVSRPGWLRGMVLLCPAHPFSGHEQKLVDFYLSVPGRVAAHAIPHLPRAALRWGFRQMLGSAYRGKDETWFETYERNLRRSGVVSHVLRVLKSWQEDMASLDRDLRAGRLAGPVLLMWGAEDRVVPAGSGRALQALLGRAEMVVLPGLGHLPGEEDPGSCAEVVSEWLVRWR